VHRMPRILLADDDPISLRFLSTALAGLGCDVLAVASGAAALAAQGMFDLLLLDRCMPDLGGAGVLSARRKRGCTAPALATTAELTTRTAAELHAAGFLDVLVKPLSIGDLARAVGAHAACVSAPAADLLDDDAALAAIGGDAVALASLRAMLALEIAEFAGSLAHGSLPGAELRERLHRLRAACGFCGAARLAAAAAALQTALGAHGTVSVPDLDDFAHACRETAAALQLTNPQAPVR